MGAIHTRDFEPWRVGALGLLTCLSTSGLALGQSSAEDAARAEVLFREGRALVKANKSADACPKFAESHRLDPQVGTLLNLALCHEEIGKTASAWAEFKEVTERAKGSKERGSFAETHALSLEARLSHLKVRVDPTVPGLSLKLDGRPLGPSALDSRIPLDPGEHALEATAPGWAPWTQEVRLAPGPSDAYVVVNLERERTPTPSVAPPSDKPQSSPPSAPAPTDVPAGHGSRMAGILATGVGITAIGVGTVFGLKAFSKKAENDSLCAGGCTSPNYELAVEASKASKTYAVVSTISVSVGVAALATGAYLLLAYPPATSHTRVVPLLTHTTAGLAFQSAW